MGVFFFNDTATTEIYTLSLHDALPIYNNNTRVDGAADVFVWLPHHAVYIPPAETVQEVNISTNNFDRSEEHTSELQSQSNLVCRLLLDNNDLVFRVFDDTQLV